MRELRTAVVIAASPQDAWTALTDVARWPEWTPSVQRTELLNGPINGVGSKARIYQPKLRPAVWTVTVWEAGHHFQWISRSLGVTVIAGHSIVKTASGCEVALSLRFTGALGTVIALISGRLAYRYLEMEAAGLRARCERGSAVGTPLSVKKRSLDGPH